MTDVKTYLEQEVHAWDTLGFQAPMQRLVLEHGQEWTGNKWTSFRGSGLRKMKVRECFANCLKTALWRNDVIYCEGYAYCGGLVAHHAWLLYDGRVADPTWRMGDFKRPEEEWSYIGVAFDHRKIMPSYVNSWSASFLEIILSNNFNIADFMYERVAA